jgi:hypothetical protein
VYRYGLSERIWYVDKARTSFERGDVDHDGEMEVFWEDKEGPGTREEKGKRGTSSVLCFVSRFQFFRTVEMGMVMSMVM